MAAWLGSGLAVGLAAGLVDKAHAAEPAASAPGLDVRRLQSRAAPASAPLDAFAPRSWTRPPPPLPAPPPAAPVEAPPPAAPQAPPLPYKYLGRLEVAPGVTRWYLLAGDRLVVASAGDEIDGRYRVDGVSPDQPQLLRFTYLPLAQAQTLAIGVPP
ncbi:MAG: hypothetical protein RL375_3983 [Pseudomonadota bacterium]